MKEFDTHIDWPPPLAPGRTRISADVTFVSDDDDKIVQSTVVDIAPALLTTYFRGHAVSARCDIRITNFSVPFLLYSSWRAASFGGVLPIAIRHVHRNGPRNILINPPWPLDYTLEIQTYSQSDSDIIIDMLSR